MWLWKEVACSLQENWSAWLLWLSCWYSAFTSNVVLISSTTCAFCFLWRVRECGCESACVNARSPKNVKLTPSTWQRAKLTKWNCIYSTLFYKSFFYNIKSALKYNFAYTVAYNIPLLRQNWPFCCRETAQNQSWTKSTGTLFETMTSHKNLEVL